MEILRVKTSAKHPKKALICYIPQSHTLPLDHPNFIGHSNFQECRMLINTLAEQGYACDVVNWNEDARQLIGANYDLAIVMRYQIEYSKQLVHEKGKVVFYSAHCHWLYHNNAEYSRIYQLQKRRQISILPRRQINPIPLEDQVDAIWYLGNDFHKDTYQHLKMPKYKLNISTVKTHHAPKKDISEGSLNHFLWFGSAGAVHKGLDWLLEIFSRNKQLHLHVCGLVELEKDFCSAFHKELFESPNIHFHGWILPNTKEFKQLCDQCSFVVSPSSAEGGGGATLQCMGMGLIPIVTNANSVDVDLCGFKTKTDTLEDLELLLKDLKYIERAELFKKMTSAIAQVENKHTLEAYKASLMEGLAYLNTDW